MLKRNKLDSIISFFFPLNCLHCQDSLEKSSHLFCLGCIPFFELIDPLNRCPYCFEKKDTKTICTRCRSLKRWHTPVAAALEYIGPVSTFVKKMKGGELYYLAKTAAAWMYAQWIQLNWPEPDMIIPVPGNRIQTFLRGPDHAFLIAKELSLLLKKPVMRPLKREIDDFKQAKLNISQRQTQERKRFLLKKTNKLEDKTLLIVDDVLTTGMTIQKASETLLEGFPRKIYALTLTRAV